MLEGLLHGPWQGRGHAAFLVCASGLLRRGDSIDDVVAAFVPNDEAVTVVLVPLATLDGSVRTAIDVNGKSIALRDHVGAARVRAAVALANSARLAAGSKRTVAVLTDSHVAATPSADQRAARLARFSQTVDVAAVDAQTREVKRKAFAPTANTRSLKWTRPREWRGAELCAGRARPGDIQSCATADDVAWESYDKLRTGDEHVDLATPEGRALILDRAQHWDALHVATRCGLWSGALCLPPGCSPAGTPPMGPYMSEAAPLGKPGLSPATTRAVDEAHAVKETCLAAARIVTSNGGTLSYENSPDCTDPSSPWFMERDGYSTRTQFPFWRDPAVAAFIADTGAARLTVPFGGAGDSPYRNYKTVLLSPLAYNHRGVLATWQLDPARTYMPMRGMSGDGRTHGAVAAEYTPRQAHAIYAIHRDAQESRRRDAARQRRGDPGAGGGGASDGRPHAPAGTAPGPSGAGSPTGAATNAGAVQGTTAPASSSRVSRLLLVLVLAGTSIGLLPGDTLATVTLAVPATAAGRHAVMAEASKLLPSYGVRADTTPLLMAGAFAAADTLEYVVAAMSDEAFGGRVVQLPDAGATAVARYVALAIASVEQALGVTRDVPLPIPDGGVLGFGPPEPVAVDRAATDDGTRLFSLRHDKDAENIDKVRRALDDEARAQLAAGDVDMSQYLAEARDGAVPTPAEAVPASVRAASRPTEPWMGEQAYAITPTPHTPPLPSPAPQRSPRNPAFAPTCHGELCTPNFLRRLDAWFAEAVAWLEAVLANTKPLPPRPEPLVAGRAEAMVADAHGTVWDTRRVAEGIVTPLDYMAPTASTWNTPWLREMWADYADREAVCHACDGADLRPRCQDLPLQFVFSPHLLSLADGYEECWADLAKLKAAGYYQWFASMPFCPCRFHGQGARPKGDGWRRIASGSCPYDPVLDGDGNYAYSLNAEAKHPPTTAPLSPGRRWRKAGLVVLLALLCTGVTTTIPDLFRRRKRFRKERKPRFADAMHDTVVLRAVGEQVGEAVYYLMDDFKHFFYQIRLASRCLWYTGMVMLDPATHLLVFIAELGLAMGYTPCSNIAQMVGDAILYIFDKLMLAVEAGVVLSAALQHIMRQRAARHGERHGRPWVARIFTDDVHATILGAARYVRAVKVWRILLRTANILGAVGSKRQSGTHCIFLGASLLATALVAYVPEDKLLRALAGLTTFLGGALDKEKARRLFGLLVHLSFLSAKGRATTAGLWTCLLRHRPEQITPTEAEARKGRAWLDLLRYSAAAPMDVAMRRLRRHAEPIPSDVRATGMTDAFLDEGAGGIGGYSHGTWWRLDTFGALLRAGISGSELLAFYVHLIVYAADHALADAVTHFVDNMNAFLAMARESARAPFMQWLYDAITSSPAFRAVADKLRVGQRWGVWLVLADAASRNYRDVIRNVGTATRVSIVERTAPPAAHAAVAGAEAAQLRLEADTAPAVPRPLTRRRPRGALQPGDSEDTAPSPSGPSPALAAARPAAARRRAPRPPLGARCSSSWAHSPPRCRR